MKCMMRFNGLDYSAKMMALAVKKASNHADRAVGDFLTMANKSNAQGAALTSMLSQARTVGIDSHNDYIMEVGKRAAKKPNTRAAFKKFVNALEQNYPQTLRDRISLASWGAVESGHVKPRSIWPRIMRTFNKLVAEE